MRRNIRSERDLYNWLFEQEEPEKKDAASDGGPSEQAKKEAEAIVNSKDVTETVNLINGASKEALDILGKGDQDGDEGDDKLEIGAPGEAVGISGLIPTQNFISLWKSCAWALSKYKSLQVNNSGDPTGQGKSIVKDGNLIIDGHHRWSSVWAITGPAAGKINAQNVSLPGGTPLEKLAKAQIAIVGALARKGVYGKVPSAAGGEPTDNILGASPEKIASLLRANIGKGGLDPNNPDPLLGDKYMEQVIPSPEGASLFGLTPTDDINTAREKIIAKVSENLASLPKGQGPARELMPQFDDDAKSVNPPGVKFKNLEKELGGGMLNVSAPAIQAESLNENRIRRIHLPGIHRSRS